MATVECPKCSTENEFSLDDDALVCDGCDAILVIDDEGSPGKFYAVVV